VLAGLCGGGKGRREGDRVTSTRLAVMAGNGSREQHGAAVSDSTAAGCKWPDSAAGDTGDAAVWALNFETILILIQSKRYLQGWKILNKNTGRQGLQW
jgi:hypothetical protein